jgi:F0F1-type ATP synthase epsilon subunit
VQSNQLPASKKGKKGKVTVVCETVLNEEQLNEDVELVRDESDERRLKKKKGPDTSQWNKLGISAK